MNPENFRELEALLAEQERLHRVVAQLDGRIDALKRRLESAEAPAVSTAPVAPARATPPPLPDEAPEPEFAPRLAEAVSPLPARQTTPAAGLESLAAAEARPLEPVIAPSGPTPPLPRTAARGSFELQLGTVWLARLGIVILITGLVFLGNYAWHLIVPRLGPAGKVAIMYLTGASILGIGAWLERGREATRNYAKVLMAGGAATVYYTTYAAHFVERLRIIESSVFAGVLLLSLAGLFIFYAERRRSQTFAVLAVLLSYYTSAINPVGSFTLYSSLLLTGASAFLLVRNRWSAVSWAALVGSYGSYGFWRWHLVTMQHGLHLEEPWRAGVAFLFCYWALFTAAVFLAKDEALPPVRRTPYLTLNNAAFFLLGAIQIGTHARQSFWLFALACGVAALALSAAARVRRNEDRSMDGAYLAQGILLVTIALAAKLTGAQLALAVAAESALLLTGIRRRHALLLEIAGGLAAAAALVLTIWKINEAPELTVRLGMTLAAIQLWNAWWSKRRRGALPAMRFEKRVAGFVAAAFSLVAMVLLREASPAWLSPACAAVAVIATASVYLLRLPEVALLGQLFVPAAAWFAVVGPAWGSLSPMETRPWWAPLPASAAALGLSSWWQRQRALSLKREYNFELQAVGALVFVGVGYFWLRSFLHGDAWLLGVTAAALGTLAYGLATRAVAVAVAGQVFALVAALAMADLDHTHWAAAAAPVANFFLTAAILMRFAPLLGAEAQEMSAATAGFYRVIGFALLARWGWHYLPESWRMLFFTLIAAAALSVALLRNDRKTAWTGAAFVGAGLFLFWGRLGWPAGWADLLGLVALPASVRIARRFAPDSDALPAKAGALLTGAITASLWLWTTQWTRECYGSGGLTIAWSALAVAVFAAGLGLRERVYRIGGFGLLALAIARVFVVDVWRLETLYRILSFLVLGAVLLGLGFVYNRYADRIRQWL